MAFFKKSVLPLALICLVAMAVYSNTLDAAFHFDDQSNIVKNALIKDFKYIIEPSRAGEAAMEFNFLKNHVFENRIVGYFTLAVNYRLGGLDVRGYHFFNIAIHIVNAFFVYWLVLVTFMTPRLRESAMAERSGTVALLSTLIFAAHPAETQAITYIVQRFASLAALFYLGSLLSYIRARLAQGVRSRYGFYALALVSAVLAMKTKEISFTLPLAIALYEFLFFSDPLKRRIPYLAPILLTMLIIPAGMLGTDSTLTGVLGEATRVKTDMSRLDYLATEARVLVTYLRLITLPVNQNVDYDYPKFGSFSDPQVLLSCLLLAALAALGAFMLRRSRASAPELRLVSFGIFWFFLAISVESSLIPIEDVIFEHRLYLPSVGIIIVFTAGAFMLAQRYKKLERAIPALLVALCLLLSVAAYARNAVWKSEVSLWADVVEKAPGNGRAHGNLGFAYEMEGDLELALNHYRAALRLSPDETTYINLSATYKKMGRIDEAIASLDEAKRFYPYSANLYNNLGVIYFNSLGQPQRAIDEYKMALSINPNNAKTHLNLGIAYRAQGLNAKADYHMGLARTLDPALFMGGH